MATAAAFHESPEISGLLYKRRGGFGKMMPNAWQYRLFIISKDGVLTYYDTEVSDADDNGHHKERGRIDLRAVHFELCNEPVEGAPTNYSIVIIPQGEEKWKMCAETKEDLSRWWKIIERYLHDTVEGNKPDVRQSAYAYCSDEDSVTPRTTDGAGQPINNQYVRQSIFQQSSQSPGASTKPATNIKGTDNKNITPRKDNTTSAIVSKPKTSSSNTTANPPAATIGRNNSISKAKPKRSLRTNIRNSTATIGQDTMEFTSVMVIINLCLYAIFSRANEISLINVAMFAVVSNVVVGQTLLLRGRRLAVLQKDNNELKEKLSAALTRAETIATTVSTGTAVTRSQSPALVKTSSKDDHHVATQQPSNRTLVAQSMDSGDAPMVNAHHLGAGFSSSSEDAGIAKTSDSGKPIPGFSFVEVTTDPKKSPAHTWCRADHRQFNVRVGPDYNRNKKKAPSPAALYEAFAVDVFCTKLRVDHAASRFELPDTSHIKTNNAFVPPIFVIQIQIPSEPPASIFSSSEDGPGWAIVMYYRITEETCQQLADLSTASPAVKLFAQWCEKAPIDAAWRGRFKVICSCSNLEEIGVPSAIASYNAKPVLIRRTGSILRGPDNKYMEMDIHVHKFANLAKQSIYLLSSRCGQMFMQIGFVVEGREDAELPETLFACVAVNKPQEENAEFLFDDDDD